MVRSIFAIDPGKTGAISLLVSYHGFQALSVWDMPDNGSPDSAWAAKLHKVLAQTTPDPTKTYIEHVGARPNQGSVSGFNFGVGFGVCLSATAIAGHPCVLVKPNLWKPKLRIPSGGSKTEKKNAAMAKATELFPQCSAFWTLKKHDGRAESALIALYGALNEGMPCDNIKPARLNGDVIT